MKPQPVQGDSYDTVWANAITDCVQGEWSYGEWDLTTDGVTGTMTATLAPAGRLMGVSITFASGGVEFDGGTITLPFSCLNGHLMVSIGDAVTTGATVKDKTITLPNVLDVAETNITGTLVLKEAN